ncbi:hypothetical protein F511_14104 [Dorcoceras hygrometricum]|uniref:MADS-box domain-containing protein n=1 Tax=Dorcoceras hygrometricum TaxID=472368 RepID=A0A2Z7AYW6_9LAMI|nr:hypothetical protein F511_14104 [Dorcoceras hygrometricum]
MGTKTINSPSHHVEELQSLREDDDQEVACERCFQTAPLADDCLFKDEHKKEGFRGKGKMDPTGNKIVSKSSKQSSFIKRHACLVKKATDLSVLCDSEIAVIVYSDQGKLFDYATSSMEQILTRFERCRRIKLGIPVNPDAEMEVGILREKMEKLKQNDDQYVLGRDLKSMSHEDLQELLQQLNEGLLCIKDRKEALLVQQLEQSRVQIESLERLSASTSYQPPLCIDYPPVTQTDFATGRNVYRPEMACTEYANFAETSLQLGPSTSKVSGKRKAPHKGRSNPDTFLTL